MTARVVGVPTEIKDHENRVAMQPDGVAELVHHGRTVLVQAGAGEGSRFPDDEFAEAGATIVDDAGRLPLLTPMSEVAGRMAVQAAAHHLESPRGGAGLPWPSPTS